MTLLEAEVLRLVDRAHPAAAEHRAHPLARELIPHQRQPRHHVLPPHRPRPDSLPVALPLNYPLAKNGLYHIDVLAELDGHERLTEN